MDPNADRTADAPPEAAPQEEMLVIGGCNGSYMLPCSDIDGYQQANACMAAGAGVLLILGALGSLAF